MRGRTILVAAATAVMGFTAAHWLNARAPEAGRMPVERVDLSAPAPRVNAKPDLSGVWEAERTPTAEFVRVMGSELPEIQPDLAEITKHVIDVFWDVKPEAVPLRPEAVALTEARQKSGRDFQTAYCLPSSLPAATLTTNIKIVQGLSDIAILHGSGDPAREIAIDGRSLPANPEPRWMGTSVGHWEDDTLVVETTGFQDRAWLDGLGHPRSEMMRVTERFRRRDYGHMDLEMTFDDPTYYTRPFGFTTALILLPDDHVYEYVCTENQKFRDYVAP